MRRFMILLFACCGLALAEDSPIRDNVVVLLDGSGSMDKRMRDGNKRMDAAKRAIIAVIDATDSATAVGLVAFCNGKVQQLAPLQTGDRAAMRREVQQLPPSGKTPLGEALRVAGDMLLEARDAQYGYGTYTLLVVTDGQASDESIMNRYAPEVVARGIRMDVIGVDMKQDHALRRIAHRYSSAGDAESLGAAVASTFAEIGGGRADAAADDFALINEVFTDESAAGVLGVLGRNDNRPIGSMRVAMPASMPAADAGDPSSPPRTGLPPVDPQQAVAEESGLPWGFIVAAVIAFIVFGRIFSRR